MKDCRTFYINGEWVSPAKANDFEVLNPATEEPVGVISLGTAADVDKAVRAARQAFETFSRTSRDDRVALLQKIIEVYSARMDEIAETISSEMGAPLWLAKAAQAPSGLGHLMIATEILKSYEFESKQGTTLITKEPVGVCGMITPWNWPINQITCKVAPAIAAGCTMVLKPSEISPLCAHLFAEVLDAAGVPAGVFNLVDGDGPTVGQAISMHPGVDMMSFTGSTRGGVAVATAAAPSVKRVTQELGGKSANILLDDVDFAQAVAGGVQLCFNNSGQSCNAPTRMLVPASRMDEVKAIAKAAAEQVQVADPRSEGRAIGPVVSQAQYDKIQGLIQKGIDEGAELVAGGPGRPEGLSKGYFVQPTVFAGVRNDMTIAREEIFGPVLSIIGYKDDDDAVRIANETLYGLSGYVSSGDLDRARNVARRIRSGNVHVNGAQLDFAASFGGYKQSGNGREWGRHGFEEFLEVKSVFGYDAA